MSQASMFVWTITGRVKRLGDKFDMTYAIVARTAEEAIAVARRGLIDHQAWTTKPTSSLWDSAKSFNCDEGRARLRVWIDSRPGFAFGSMDLYEVVFGRAADVTSERSHQVKDALDHLAGKREGEFKGPALIARAVTEAGVRFSSKDEIFEVAQVERLRMVDFFEATSSIVSASKEKQETQS